MDGWQTKRCAGVEAALTDAALAPHTLVAALEALPADTQPLPTKQEFVDAAAQGILLEALAPLVQQVRLLPGGNATIWASVWTIARLEPGVVHCFSASLPDCPLARSPGLRAGP